MPGGSSQVTPPFATPAACHASPCSGDATLKPMVLPLPWQAGWPSIGTDKRKDACIGHVEHPTFWIHDTLGVTDGGHNGIVKSFGFVDVIGTHHDVTEHIF